MNLAQLVELDSTLKLELESSDAFDAKGICHVSSLVSGEFCFIKSRKYFKRIAEKNTNKVSDVGAIIQKKFLDSLDSKDQLVLKDHFEWVASVEDVPYAMTLFSKPFYDQKFSQLNVYLDGRQLERCTISPNAEIAQNVFIGHDVTIEEDVVIMPGCKIMPFCKIRKGTVLFPDVVLYPFVEVGENCRIHSSVVLGADGFGYIFKNGQHNKIWHFGGVKIGNDVEIGSNSTVDAGAFWPTTIGHGSKVDNHCTIGHNVQMGNGVVVCGKGSIAGSVEIGDFSVFGGMVGISPDCRIGSGVQVAAGSIISEGSHIKNGEKLGGHPARPINEWLKGIAFVRRQSLK